MTTPHIAMIGAGNVGAALGARLAASGYHVTFGVRDTSKIESLLQRCGALADAASPAEAAARADVIILAVPGPVAVEAARSLGDLSGKVIVDCNNPLRWESGPVWTPPAEGSLTAAIAMTQPGAHVVKAFNTFGAEFHADPSLGDTHADVYIAGDTEGRAIVAELATRAGFCAIDAGPERNAAVLENLAILWIHLALAGGQGRDVAFKLLRR